jgi:hypothetical protein
MSGISFEDMIHMVELLYLLDVIDADLEDKTCHILWDMSSSGFRKNMMVILDEF